MFGAYDNRMISLDLSSAYSICHQRPNFQCWLVSNDLKSETNIAYVKLKNAAVNSRKSGVKNIIKSLYSDIYIMQVCKSGGKNIFQSLKNWIIGVCSKNRSTWQLYQYKNCIKENS